MSNASATHMTKGMLPQRNEHMGNTAKLWGDKLDNGMPLQYRPLMVNNAHKTASKRMFHLVFLLFGFFYIYCFVFVCILKFRLPFK